MTRMKMTTLAALSALACTACEIEPHTGMPVWSDSSTSGRGIPTVPPHYPGPLVSDYPKLPPLDGLDPETGKSRPWSSWWKGEVHTTEAKIVHALAQRGAR